MTLFRFVTYNVFGGTDPRRFLDDRLEAIATAVVAQGAPDVVCLQEATDPVIDAVRGALAPFHPQITVFDKRAFLSGEDELRFAATHGRLVLLSGWPMREHRLVRTGSSADDGVVSALVDSPSGPIRVYGVHCAGGTFGRPAEVVAQKQRLRVEELRTLVHALEGDPEARVVIGGDFNYDANDLSAPETAWSPDLCIADMVDAWSVLRPGDVGATEDEHVNTFRAAMKVKPTSQLRCSRYDRILTRGLRPLAIDMIGTEPLATRRWVAGRTPQGAPRETEASLFASDHFGVVAELGG